MMDDPKSPRKLTHANLRSVERQVERLRQQYIDGQLTRADFREKLHKLMLTDDQGRWWALGHESNQWYVYEDRQWREADPLDVLPVLPEPSPPVPTATAAPRAEPPPEPLVPAGDASDETPPRPPLKDLEATVVAGAAFDIPSAEPGPQAAPTHAAGRPQRPEPQTTRPAGGYRAQPPRPAAAPRGPPGAQPTQPAGAGAAPPPGDEGSLGDFADFDPARRAPEAEKGRFDRRRLLQIFGIGVAGVLLLLFIFFATIIVTYFSVVAQYEDEINNLRNLAIDFASSVIYDVFEQPIGEIVPPQGRRLAVELDRVSPYLIHATVATENERFYEDPGYDWIAMIRALIQNVFAGGIESGASTITQQVVRATILDPGQRTEVTTWRKVQEVILAAEVSRRYSKDDILYLYLNNVHFGNLAYGVEAAAQTYFDKPASALNVAESAFIAGIPQAPAIYDPVRRPDDAFNRMDAVLELMATANGNGCIQFQHGDWRQQGPFCISRAMWADPNAQGYRDALLVKATIFEPPEVDTRYPHYVQFVRDWLIENLTDVPIDGLHVYTPFDPRIQDLAQNAVNQHLATLPNVTNAAVVVMQPQTGAIAAMIGSANFYDEAIQGQINMALRPRQTGSSIKPFTYLAGFEKTAGRRRPSSGTCRRRTRTTCRATSMGSSTARRRCGMRWATRTTFRR
ncbi:MAG: transglycosylase domain-containing protein [Anaerolineae bacterium]|nr:transglycosylase domain-containing protein [Anaerolineae bacterium]